MLSGMAAGVSAFFSGILAIIRQKDDAILVYNSTIIGAVLLIFLIAEVLFPH
jgi:hypothetical protein